MPICIILGPLNWTRPDLIHIEGDRDRHHAQDPESPAAEEASAQGCSPVPDQRAAAPQPEGVATKGGPPRARVTCAAGGLGRGVQLGPGMTTSHISYIIIRYRQLSIFHLTTFQTIILNYKQWRATSRLRIRNSYLARPVHIKCTDLEMMKI